MERMTSDLDALDKLHAIARKMDEAAEFSEDIDESLIDDADAAEEQWRHAIDSAWPRVASELRESRAAVESTLKLLRDTDDSRSYWRSRALALEAERRSILRDNGVYWGERPALEGELRLTERIDSALSATSHDGGGKTE